ncbi:LIPT1 [Branchiostoma lanceolatum]|uniref:LIPT1 protein n=1 Tax=Branchiostoma lanceolatum TaxID=7740 RepID=A0A8J9ZKY0_BRALA|nr:LIPT1 [Branchiostoma lanceolatum]
MAAPCRSSTALFTFSTRRFPTYLSMFRSFKTFTLTSERSLNISRVTKTEIMGRNWKVRCRKLTERATAHRRCFSSATPDSGFDVTSDTRPKPKGIVYKSTSTDTFANLAFEDWLYENQDFTDTDILLLWRNEPTVVIGRHQNPWAECKVKRLQELGIHLARRRSGGGTVYHDFGNLNVTFLTSRDTYRRKQNLQDLVTALKGRWPSLDLSVNKRDDLVLNDRYKLSGTAAKLGRKTANHHCTLLCDVNTQVLKDILVSGFDGLETTATESIRSEVVNLKEVDPTIDTEVLGDTIAEYFMRNHQGDMKQVCDVDPTSEALYPGVGKITEELKSWEWIYGKTPPFNICLRKPVDGLAVPLGVYMKVKKGVIVDSYLECPLLWVSEGVIQDIGYSMRGKRFRSVDVQAALEKSLQSYRRISDNERQFAQRLCQFIVDKLV